MNQLLLPAFISILVVYFLALVLLVFSSDIFKHFLVNRKPSGDYVCEVWLEWPLCRGSTMFRTRCKTKQAAEFFVRVAAYLIDLHLPKYYRDTDWAGNPVLLKYDFGIYYGVRKTSGTRADDGSFLTLALPGHKGHSGEHPTSHPLY